MSGPSVSFVEIDGIPREKLSHEGRDTLIPALQQKVHVVTHQCPRIEGTPGERNILAELIEESLPIRIVDKEIGSLYSPDNHVMQGAWRIQAGVSRHEVSLR